MDTPIACSLTAAQYRDRTTDLAALANRALRSRETTDHGERLSFARSDEIERELEAVIVAESSCCAFLTFDLQRHDDHLALDITGSAEARPVIAELFAA
ncbi:MAG TPA: hypothetical protein VNP89_09145 [Gaiellaceae bacterium]|nr:hypothetical protein [Gaiellaceae bacterium]